MMSVPPPGGNGTTTRIGLEGQAWAKALRAERAAASASRTRRRRGCAWLSPVNAGRLRSWRLDADQYWRATPTVQSIISCEFIDRTFAYGPARPALLRDHRRAPARRAVPPTKLHRTQPALTSCVRRLEEDCGVAAVRAAPGAASGSRRPAQVLLKWAQRMRFDVEDAKREIAAHRHGPGRPRAHRHRADRGAVPAAGGGAPAAAGGAGRHAAHRGRPGRHPEAAAARGRDRPDGRHREPAPKPASSPSCWPRTRSWWPPAPNHEAVPQGRPTLKDLTRVPLGAAAARRADARLAGPHLRPQAPAAPAGPGREHDAADAADADRSRPGC